MDVDDVVDRLGVAAGHDDRHRHAGRGERIEDEPIAVGEALLAQRQPAETVADVRIGAGQVDREARPRPVWVEICTGSDSPDSAA